jgi:hypothetical protein
MCSRFLKPESNRQYQAEERVLMLRRVRVERYRLKSLLDAMRQEALAPPEKIRRLCLELNTHHKTNEFDGCDSMGDVVRLNLKLVLTKA